MNRTILTWFATTTLILLSCGNDAEKMALEERHKQDSINLLIEKTKNEAILNERNKIEAEQRKIEEEQQRLQEEKRKIESKRYIIDDIIGVWQITMNCTKSNCSNTKLGDRRTETWYINYESGKITVKVTGNSNTSNAYIGTFNGKFLNLHYKLKQSVGNSIIEVQMKMTNENKLSGTREVLNPGPCQIEYTINGNKN